MHHVGDTGPVCREVMGMHRSGGSRDGSRTVPTGAPGAGGAGTRSAWSDTASGQYQSHPCDGGSRGHFVPADVVDAFDFRGRVVVVTGGSRGIGRAVAERFLGGGADVVVCGRSEAERRIGSPTVDDRTGSGDGRSFGRADVRDADAARRPRRRRRSSGSGASTSWSTTPGARPGRRCGRRLAAIHRVDRGPQPPGPAALRPGGQRRHAGRRTAAGPSSTSRR